MKFFQSLAVTKNKTLLYELIGFRTFFHRRERELMYPEVTHLLFFSQRLNDKISDMYLTSEQAEEHGSFGMSTEIHQDQVPRS